MPETAQPAASIACNRCNTQRSIKVQPCPRCQSPEYRLLPLPGQTRLPCDPGPSDEFQLTGNPKRRRRK